MKKDFSIIWSPFARETYLSTLEVILKNWTLKEAIAFDRKAERLIEKLRTHKHLCPESSKEKGYRRCVITKQTSLVYTISESTIELVAFFDNRSLHSY